MSLNGTMIKVELLSSSTTKMVYEEGGYSAKSS